MSKTKETLEFLEQMIADFHDGEVPDDKAIQHYNTIRESLKKEGEIMDKNNHTNNIKTADIINTLPSFVKDNPKFKYGDRVRKKGDKGQWHGCVVGFYSTDITPIGYAVESERETGSVQIYPERALEKHNGGESLQKTDDYKIIGYTNKSQIKSASPIFGDGGMFYSLEGEGRSIPVYVNTSDYTEG